MRFLIALPIILTIIVGVWFILFRTPRHPVVGEDDQAKFYYNLALRSVRLLERMRRDEMTWPLIAEDDKKTIEAIIRQFDKGK